ncbi:hypothetical protein ACQPXH_20150 [Nocardia sp. CA-135953]|uniref:hypothetical protein n=1 Tax=Nocardia sp. CA-135953 TaxID=3239978 RepID=UPI003D971B8C
MAAAAKASPIPLRRFAVRTGRQGEFEAERAIVADDPYQCGHYPDYSIYPGVFIVENVVRAALAALADAFPGRAWRLHCLRSGRFTAPVRPGDRLLVHGTFTMDEQIGRIRVRARCLRGDGVAAATVRLTFAPEEVVDADAQ